MSLLNCLAAAVPARERVITCEEVFEQAIALPEVAGDLGADQTELTWVVDAYALTFAALLPPAGIAADRVGRRTLLVGGLVVFGAAGMVSAYAADPRPVVDGPAERRRQQESVGFGQLVERPVQD